MRRTTRMRTAMLCAGVCASSATTAMANTSPVGATGADIDIVAVTATRDDGNVAENVLDDDLATRWSAEGDGNWIRFDLGAPTEIDAIEIGFYLGDRRTSRFNVQTSNDAVAWNHALIDGDAIASSSGTRLVETFDFADVTARYVRIVGYGNSNSAWNSLTEVDIVGTGGVVAPPSAGAVYVRPGADGSGSATDPVGSVQRALQIRTTGQQVLLQSGTYGSTVISENCTGSASDPIVIGAAPGANAVLGQPDISRPRINARGLAIEGCRHVTVQGLRITRVAKGIQVNASHHIELVGNTVDTIDDEAIAFRERSSQGRIVGNTITRTGQTRIFSQGALRAFGEGIYLGNGRLEDDPVTGIEIIDNDISSTGDEAIDVKNPVTDVTIRGNRIHDIETGTTGAVVLHLNDKNPAGDAGLVVRDNRIWNIGCERHRRRARRERHRDWRLGAGVQQRDRRCPAQRHPDEEHVQRLGVEDRADRTQHDPRIGRDRHRRSVSARIGLGDEQHRIGRVRVRLERQPGRNRPGLRRSDGRARRVPSRSRVAGDRRRSGVDVHDRRRRSDPPAGREERRGRLRTPVTLRRLI